MAILSHDCPHCGTSDIALRIAGWQRSTPTSGAICLICPKCLRPSGALIESDRASFDTAIGNAGDPINNGFRLLNFWPAPPKPVIPEHLPEPVTKSFKQAESNYAIAGNEEASAMMYRRAMEGALKSRFPDVTGMLDKRIKALVREHHLPPAMGDWANEIRQIGNDAAHEEDGVSRDELDAIRNFSDTLLRYVFTLPREIELRRAARTLASEA